MPRSQEELQRRSRMMLHWARYSGGMMGRSPDYLNVSMMASAAAAEFYGQNDPRMPRTFGSTIPTYGNMTCV